MENRYENLVLKVNNPTIISGLNFKEGKSFYRLFKMGSNTIESLPYTPSLSDNTFEKCESFKRPPLPANYIHVHGTALTGYVIERKTDGFQRVWCPINSLPPNGYIQGNYCFDNASNIKAKNCTFLSRDAFWNVKDAVIEDSFIDGEYLAWNSSNITFIRCKIISHQGICYSKNVKLIDCQITNSDLIFEYCENIDADIDVENVSIKNPRSGSIFLSKGCKIIKNEKYIDPNKTKIVIK